MQTKMISGEVKSLESDNPNGEFLVKLSTPSLDRDGEVVAPGCFDPLPDHITFDVDHGLKTSAVVGSGVPYYDGNDLMVKGTFSSIARAQEIRTLVNERHIRSTSVAMRAPKKETKDGVTTIFKAELLNGSFVAVPANRDALVVLSKVGARNSTSDQETIQAIHDYSGALGAACDGKAAKRIQTKGVTFPGSFEERQEELSEAIEAMYADADWVNILATYDDRVVYEVMGGASDDMQFETPYTWDGDEVTLGTPAPVEAEGVVTPAQPGDEKSVSDAQSADDGEAMKLRAHAWQLLSQAI